MYEALWVEHSTWHMLGTVWILIQRLEHEIGENDYTADYISKSWSHYVTLNSAT